MYENTGFENFLHRRLPIVHISEKTPSVLVHLSISR